MEYAIEVNNLVKRYKDMLALDHFNKSVKEGGIRSSGTEWIRKDHHHKLYPFSAFI